MADALTPPPSPLQARFALAVLAVLALLGLALGWNKGQLPRPRAAADIHAKTAPDLQLYREIIAEVRSGGDYYEVARRKLPEFGFPIGSPLNWRLPTYAWAFSLLPSKCWIQALLLVLAIGGLCLAFVAQCARSSVGHAALTTFLLFGVIRWTIDGEAYLAQEVWASALILISLSAHAIGGRESGVRGRELGVGGREVGWRCLAVAAGIAALLFRELALPYCAVACLVAAANRRWTEAAAWAGGIALFFSFFAWHVGQVRAQLAGVDVAAGAGFAQWLRFGGLGFVLLTTRMNSLLFAAPAGLLWLYLLASLVGLARRSDDTSRLACLAALAYVLAFAVVGRPENFYWGLMAAPLLPWGVIHAPQALAELWEAGGKKAKSIPGAGHVGRAPKTSKG